MICNYHTHTARCGHASGTEREYIEKAIAEGLTVLGFSDHVPMPFPDGFQSHFRCPIEKLDDYVTTLVALREEYKERIKILIGFEAEYYPDLFAPMMKMLSDYPIDYLIMGQHFVGNERGENYNGWSFTEDEKIPRYVDQVIEGAKTGAFTYIAHPDLLGYSGENGELYRREMRRLCAEMKAMGIPLEFNLLGFEEHRNYPCDRFWEIVSEVGNEVILGCDAHHAVKVADKGIISAAEEKLRRFGLTPLDSVTLRDPFKANY